MAPPMGDRSAVIPPHYAGDVFARSPRVTVLLGVVAGGAMLGLSSCGDDPSAAPTVSTIAVTSTTYVTIPARTTTSTIAAVESDSGSDDGGGGATASSAANDPTQERVYEIQAGDYLVGIAADFDVPVNYLPEYNGWTDGLRHALVPGQEMRIPPSDWDPNGPAASDASTDGSGASAPDDTTEACADGEQPETYTIQPGDIPANVAEDHGVSVAELNAANTNTPNYRGFVVGIEINIPC